MLVKQVETNEELKAAHKIRKDVFVIEQNCPEDIEWEFEEESHHFIALLDGSIAGTARWRETENGYKLERFAVSKEHRNKQVGEAVLTHVIMTCLKTVNRFTFMHSWLQRTFTCEMDLNLKERIFGKAGSST